MHKRDFYQKLRLRLKDWATGEGKDSRALKLIMLAPDFFHLLCKVLLDARVPGRAKAKVGAAIAYLISPLDVIPEGLIGPAGYVDDVALAAYVLKSDIIFFMEGTPAGEARPYLFWMSEYEHTLHDTQAN